MFYLGDRVLVTSRGQVGTFLGYHTEASGKVVADVEFEEGEFFSFPLCFVVRA